MPTPTSFGRRLAELRGTRELTQQQLAEKANIPAAVISHFETGVRASASADNLVKLADALTTTVDYLLARTDDPSPPSGTFERLVGGLSANDINALETFTDALARRARGDRPPGP
jgi:transcriptional regulator with XRE-family HTH domain